MPSNHLVLCRPLLLSPSVSPIIRVFSNELAGGQSVGDPKGFRSSMPDKDQICISCHKSQYHTLSFLLLQEFCNFQKSHSAWGDHMKQWKDQHSNLLCSTGNSTQDSVIDYKEKESKKEWRYICVTDSLCCTAETRQCCKSVTHLCLVQSLSCI